MKLGRWSDLSHGTGKLVGYYSCMKLRIKGNSIRLRLNKTEVDDLKRSGIVENEVGFGTSSPGFRYCLETGTGELRCEFDGTLLRVVIGAADAIRWASSGEIGRETVQKTGDDTDLRILIEKDFACLAERAGEDDLDAFVNPLANASK